jgi:hypothetical protein
MPNAGAAEIADAVKREYGHAVKLNMVYMVKTKSNMAATRRKTKTATSKGSPWVRRNGLRPSKSLGNS